MATRFAVLKDGHIRFESDIQSWKAAQQFTMHLEVGDAEAANAVLLKHGFHGSTVNSNTVKVDHLPRREQPRLHAILIGEDIELFQSYQNKTSLEQWFTNENTD